MKAGTKKLIDSYLDRFANRGDVYAMQFVKDASFQYFPVWRSFTTDVMHSCLKGEFGLGLYALSANGFGKWICFDSDVSDGELDKLENWLKQHGWYCIREGKREGKDGHLWICFAAPIPGKDLRILGTTMLQQSGAVIKELFPKQDVPIKVGSLVRAPLSRHFKPGAGGRRGLFESAAQNVNAQLQWLSEQPLNDSAKALELAHVHRPMPKPLILRRRDYGKNKIDFVAWAVDNGFTKKGDEWNGPCPSCIKNYNHDPTHPHLFVNEKKNTVHCFRENGCSFLEILNSIKLDIFKAAI